MKTMKVYLSILAIYLASLVTCQNFELEFKENGHKYEEQIKVDKQNNIVIYDVPQHGSIIAATYLRDFTNRLVVRKLQQDNLCYVWKMSSDEAAPDSLINGLKKNHFKFPDRRYMVVTELIIPIGKFDVSQYPIIADFCQNREAKRVQVFDSLKHAEKEILERIRKHYAHYGKTKRQARPRHVTKPTQASGRTFLEYDACDNTAVYTEVARCYRAKRLDLLSLRCKMRRYNTCTYWTKCAVLNVNNQLQYKCQAPRHTMTKAFCCNPKCDV